jgi:hypothetical protein
MTSLTAEPTSATTYPLSWEAAIYHRIFSCQAFLFKKEIFFSHSPQKRWPHQRSGAYNRSFFSVKRLFSKSFSTFSKPIGRLKERRC